MTNFKEMERKLAEAAKSLWAEHPNNPSYTGLTGEGFRVLWAQMNPTQKQSVKNKANWEHMSLRAVLDEWGPPNLDGTWDKDEEKPFPPKYV